MTENIQDLNELSVRMILSYANLKVVEERLTTERTFQAYQDAKKAIKVYKNEMPREVLLILEKKENNFESSLEETMEKIAREEEFFAPIR